MARARDFFLRRKKLPTLEDILKNPSSRTRQKSGRQHGLELREAIGRGDVPLQDYTKPYKSDKDAAEQRRRAQAKSPLLIEAIKRRLIGDRIGSPITTKEDYEQLRNLSELAETYRLKQSALARRRKEIQDKLKGQVGLVQRAILKAQSVGISGVEALFEGGRNLLDKITGEGIRRKLAGFGIGKMPGATDLEERRSEPGMRQTTPYQNRGMSSVASSNVASIGWEPHNPDETPKDTSLGTLFIQFLNGWMYKYVDAPFWLYQALMRAPSKGKAVWGLIRRGLYPDGVPYGSASVEGYERIR